MIKTLDDTSPILLATSEILSFAKSPDLYKSAILSINLSVFARTSGESFLKKFKIGELTLSPS